MSVTKAMRQQVYEKYGGHCAYCGRQIEYKEMQVDHSREEGRELARALWEAVKEVVKEKTKLQK